MNNLLNYEKSRLFCAVRFADSDKSWDQQRGEDRPVFFLHFFVKHEKKEEFPMAEAGSSTKQLEQKLGFGDLMGSAVGQIIGAGIMSLMPSAIAMTGRSVPLAFLIAATITCIGAIPNIFLASTVRLRGGAYTQMAMLGGPVFAGMSVITTFTGCFSLAMYCNSLADYVGDLFAWEGGTKKMAALAVILIFYALNIIGVDIFAKVQNLLVIILIFSLVIFAVMGIGKVQWEGYFSNDDGYFMTNGLMGLCQAGGLLTFATGGATVILNFSAEAKNPTRDIPVVIIVSTLCVAVMYGFISFVAAGVLPIEEVAGKNLTLVANVILNRPLYYLFVIGGAGCALASTLNNQLATTPKPIMQMCDDGWLPQSFAKLNKKKVPIVILTVYAALGVFTILTGISITFLSNMTQVTAAVTGVVIAWGPTKLPKMVPEAWEKSKFHVSDGALKALCALGVAGSLFNTYMNASNLSLQLLLINLGILAFAVVFGMTMSKRAHITVSYEVVD